MEAMVATGYVRRDMALPDAQLELTVRLGTIKLGLRRIGELAVGEVIGLGRPLSGPYEIHVAGRKIGEGELVDIDGEVGVRIVSLIEE
jgi:flagellar motor switch/type III secretory pathway protein FliN